jgi:peroxiredoxin
MRKCLKSQLLLWLLIFYPVIEVYGQTQPAEVDSTFESYLRAAWNEVTESGYSDSLQIQYAKEFYTYYKNNKNSETAELALHSAFMMWGNTGDDSYLHEALSTIDTDSDLWYRFGIPVQLLNIYARNENLDVDDSILLLHELENQLTHPKSKSSVYRWLKSHYHGEQQYDKAIKYARLLVETDADEWFVDHGLGYLYEVESLQVGQKAPDFKSETLEGEILSLSELKGKFVLIEFWGTWCGPCYPEIPHLKKLWDLHGENNIVIIGVALDEDEATVNNVINEQEMPWPQILQPDLFGGELVDLFNVTGVPRMYLIDTEGKIAARDLRGEEMVSEVERLISEYFGQN